MDDQLSVKFAAFLESLKQSGLDDVANSRAFHHSAVDPREWKKIAETLSKISSGNDKRSGDKDERSEEAN
ncbi:hypothetical protein FBY14_103463 [Azospirillum brasilense]|nr:hypothetical protein FBY14_103463 [Azospirillum brasilense]